MNTRIRINVNAASGRIAVHVPSMGLLLPVSSLREADARAAELFAAYPHLAR